MSTSNTPYLRTGAQAWEILKNVILDTKFLFTDQLNITDLLQDPNVFTAWDVNMQTGTRAVERGVVPEDVTFADDQTLTVKVSKDMWEQYGLDPQEYQAQDGIIALQLSYLEGDNMGVGLVGDVDDLLAGLNFGPQNIDAFWNNLSQDERDRVRASLWYKGLYGVYKEGPNKGLKIMPKFGEAPNVNDSTALAGLSNSMLQAGGTANPRDILWQGEKDHINSLADISKDTKTIASRDFLANIYEKDSRGISQSDLMITRLQQLYEDETGLKLEGDKLSNAFDFMLKEQLGEELSAESRYGRDTMMATDVFLGHYFNNGYYTPQWQQVMGRERLDRGTFIDTAVNMGLGTRQEIRKLRSAYDRNFGEIVTGVSDPFKPYDRSDNIRRLAPHERDFDSEIMQRYLALEKQVMRESFAGILKSTRGDLLTASYLFNEGIGHNYYNQENMTPESMRLMVDSTNAHLASGSDVVSMSPSDVSNTPEDIARRALIGANINLNTGHKAAGAAKALAQAMVQGWGLSGPSDYRSVT